MNDDKNPENIDQERLSVYQQTMKIIVSSLIAGFVFYVFNDALYFFTNEKFISFFSASIFFIVIFKLIYKNTIIYKNPLSMTDKNFNSVSCDYTPGDINDSRNPFSYTTPGSKNYIQTWADRDRFNDHNR
jgi:hypothetical protein